MSIIESALVKSENKKSKTHSKIESTFNLKKSAVLNPKNSKNGREKIASMSQGKLFSLSELVDRHLVYAGMSDAVLLNKYRNLRTKLLTRAENENFITLITSATPDSESSLVAANLAATFAFDESKTTILIEANIRNPGLNQLLEVNAKKGLIDFLQHDNLSEEEILYETPVERLRLVPSGIAKENSSEYMSSEKMRRFLKQMVSRYPNRYPIIDAPSIVDSADTQILVDLCDQVILVVPYGKCTQEEVKYAATAIGKNKLAGIVLDEF